MRGYLFTVLAVAFLNCILNTVEIKGQSSWQEPLQTANLSGSNKERRTTPILLRVFASSFLLYLCRLESNCHQTAGLENTFTCDDKFLNGEISKTSSLVSSLLLKIYQCEDALDNLTINSFANPDFSSDYLDADLPDELTQVDLMQTPAYLILAYLKNKVESICKDST